MRRRLLPLLGLVLTLVPALVTTVAAPAAAAGDDTVLAFGDAAFAGSTSGVPLSSSLVGMAAKRTGTGYWLVGRDGGIFAFGDAGFFGSTGDIQLNQPIVGMTATRSGNGYWTAAGDGGIFAFGDAGFLGSMGGVRLARPVVAMAATGSGNGYWLVAADGGMFAFGDAAFHGSAADQRLGKPVVAMAATPDGGGYWLVGGDGAVYGFGNAAHLGNAPGNVEVASIAASPSGNGYWLLDRAGGVFSFGDAVFAGSASGAVPPGKVALALAPSPSGNGYWITTSERPLVPGATGPGVATLQARLHELGYWVPVDGRFSATTTQALYALQKAAGIPRTGQFDAPTARALDERVLPTPRTTSGYGVEIDKSRQLLMLVSNGRIVRVFNTSTGNGARYRSGSGTAIAHTPEGSFSVLRQINGLRISELGQLFRPKYFTGGYAIHGSPSIPPYPASHGCVRVSNAAINFLWDSGEMPIGTPVLV
ncbi:MAG: L,D-transpeptidase family protein, partial [Actinobacteria bacterium]|nr:L,D-transpeptidase family protein [Actinomycetota bacterium]